MEDILQGENLPHFLALLRAPDLGAIGLGKLIGSGVAPSAIFALPTGDLRELGLSPGTVNYIISPSWSAVEKDLQWLEQEGNSLVTLYSPFYPVLLKKIHDPPPALYVKGDPGVLSDIQLGVVGSRRATADGRRTARDFARQLALAGLTITSGLALGIDSSSHRGAIDATGRTIAVLGNGLNTVYPASNEKLAESILAQGALVSELPLDYRPMPANFPRRNRLISGMATGVLVVESAARSGSLITARCAMEQGREVFAIPGSIHNPMVRGCHSLLREGAKLVEQIRDITEELGPLSSLVSAGLNPSVQTQASIKGLDADAKLLLDSIGYQPVTVDDLVEELGFTAPVISASLLNMELEGLVELLPEGRYIRKS